MDGRIDAVISLLHVVCGVVIALSSRWPWIHARAVGTFFDETFGSLRFGGGDYAFFVEILAFVLIAVGVVAFHAKSPVSHFLSATTTVIILAVSIHSVWFEGRGVTHLVNYNIPGTDFGDSAGWNIGPDTGAWTIWIMCALLGVGNLVSWAQSQ